MNKEEILDKWLKECFEDRPLHFDTIGKIHEAMDEYCSSETKRLREALEKIARPLKYLQDEAEKEGKKLDGGMAILVSNNANWLSSIATEALNPELLTGSE